jgi:Tol biopolymer transport system component
MDLCKLKFPSRGVKPVVLLTGIQSTISFSPDELGSSISFSHDESRLMYARELVQSNLWRFERRTSDQVHPTVTQITSGTGFNSNPSLSPDGRTVAFVTGDRAPSNISTIPIAGGDEDQLTFMNSQNVFPTWSPSGEEIAFLSNDGGPWRIWKVSTRGGPPQVLERSRPMDAPNNPAWAPGGRIAYQGPGRKVLAILDPRSGVEGTAIRDDSASLMTPQWSADGTRLAFLRWRGDLGSGSVCIRPVSGGNATSICDSVVIPIGWSRDGQWVYGWNHLDFSERILAIPVRGGAPKVIMEIPGSRQMANPTVTGDGLNAVASVVVRQRDAWLVENFQRLRH